jgi:hypothetical protein
VCTVVVFCREDEVAKHSNGLVVKTFHQSRKKSAGNIILRDAYNGISELHDVDVIISTTTFAWPDKSGSTLYKFVLSSCDNNDSTSLCYPVTKNVDFHRVVHDKSHLFSTNSADIKRLIRSFHHSGGELQRHQWLRRLRIYAVNCLRQRRI